MKPIEMHSYEVFPGMQLTFYAIHVSSVPEVPMRSSRILEIMHCQEGRIEFGSESHPHYLSPGDMAVCLHEGDAPSSKEFPLSHYHGISLQIDLDAAPRCLSCFLDDVSVSPAVIAEKFCDDHPDYVARSSHQIEHIFSELYNVPENIRSGYFKVKILELMLFLSEILEVETTRRPAVPPAQVDMAKRISRYLTSHLTERITLEELSTKFGASVSYIQNCFKAVYGASVASYLRTQRMQAAATKLASTDRTVSDIASEFGYDNASKFAKAFREVMEFTPAEYRKNRYDFGAISYAYGAESPSPSRYNRGA